MEVPVPLVVSWLKKEVHFGQCVPHSFVVAVITVMSLFEILSWKK